MPELSGPTVLVRSPASIWARVVIVLRTIRSCTPHNECKDRSPRRTHSRMVSHVIGRLSPCCATVFEEKLGSIPRSPFADLQSLKSRRVIVWGSLSTDPAKGGCFRSSILSHSCCPQDLAIKSPLEDKCIVLRASERNKTSLWRC